MRAKPRVLMGLTEVAGYYTMLRRGFAEMGVEATHVDLSQHRFRYEMTPPRHALIRFAQEINLRFRRAAKGGLAARLFWLGAEALSHALLFAWAVTRFDVFIFAAGHSFFEGRDLQLLRFLGKKVVLVFHGSDSRPPYIDGTIPFQPDEEGIRNLIDRTARQRAKLRRCERNADAVVTSPLQGHFMERPFIHFGLVGLPQPPVSAPPAEPQGRVRVLHCPSNPEGKGTARIRDAIRELVASGEPIDYEEIIGRPNAEVHAAIARSSFVVDQVFSDVLMAGFAAEAARYGRPAVVTGYGVREYAVSLAPAGVPPVCSRPPAELRDAVRELATSTERRRDLGRKALEFVETTWSRARVACRFLRIAAGDIPVDWQFDPRALRYAHGWGLTEEKARERVRAVVRVAGPAGLQLSHNPELERFVLDFAGESLSGAAPSASARG